MGAPLVIDLLTLFPEMVEGYFSCSMLGRARQNGLLDIRVHNIRDWATDKHKVTDDRPFGGGAGMVMKPEPIVAAIETLRTETSQVIYLAPDGQTLTRELAETLATGYTHLILLSGHYEGIDQRIRDHWIDQEISIGDYVLTNGTLPAAVLIDCMARFIPGVLGEPTSVQDSFTDQQLSYPQYTRPAEFRGLKVPEVLMNGHHAEIEKWRQQQQQNKTRERRPDLFAPKP
ncbi:MAG: tRNA (guanosine(37)-N1)-methyltransferase TrmD [Puniceicoccaceae bacterium]